MTKIDIEITDQLKIQHELRMFYEMWFKRNICTVSSKKVSFLDNNPLSVVNNDFFNLCENDLSEDELVISLKCMEYNKIPGHGGLMKDFYEIFRNETKCFS